METNTGLIAIVAVAIIVLMIVILRKNSKDKKELTDAIDTSYKKKTDDRESEISGEAD